MKIKGIMSNKMYYAIVLISVVLASCPAWAGTVIYVDDDAPFGGDGSSWDTAYRFLQDGLSSAVTGAGNLEIRVAQGGYKPDEGANKTPGDRRASFELGSGLVLNGGYAGLGMPNPNTRDITLYETILSGDLMGDDADVNDPCDLENDLSRAENSYHVVHIEDGDITTLLEGVTVTGGYAWTIGGPGRGASWKKYSGGGLLCLSSEDPIIAKCTFLVNFAERGGGMYNSSNAKIIECTFTMNAASVVGGEGGGMFSGGKPVIEKCRFIRNRASGGGGISDHHAESTLNNCSFVENSASAGGGILVMGGKAVFSGCIFKRNLAQGGGGMRISVDEDSLLINCLFEANLAQDKGGAIENHVSRDLLIKNCTFVQNSALRGSAFFHDERSRNTCLDSCILWDQDRVIWMADRSSITVAYSNVQGGWVGIGNIDKDPIFADPNNGDYHLKSQGGRWDPNYETWIADEVTSPCINAGDPNSPIMYEPFPTGGVINMGAYGGTVKASKSYFGEPVCETIVAGDINGDGKVDFEDLAILMSHWTE